MRSSWKINTISKNLNKNISKKENFLQKKKYKIFNSKIKIIADMMNLVFFVYYGNKYKKIIIQEIHIGIILGSLLLTRFNNGHLHKEKIKKSNIIKKKKK